ncbi:DEAD/DEAH box helicase [Terrabacter sp. NPDC000476]|uniref:DEAD/DEAH box helicase n=1 Tax=Terrabacter sp. NPDC000476 TaxID=3154258 RepID=UPI0033272F7B
MTDPTRAVDGPTFVGDLFPHQRAGVQFLVSQPRALLADAVGLGKTAMAAALLAHAADAGELLHPDRLPVLWVTTASLITQTIAELRKFIPSLQVASLTASPGQPRGPRRLPDVLVTHHDMAHRRYSALSTMRPVVVIVDEASATKGKGERFESIRDLCATASRAVALTATPQENDPTEFWAMLSLIGVPGLPSRERFEEWYVQLRTYSNGRTQCIGWKGPAAANYFLHEHGSHFLRRTTEDVGLALPHKVDSVPVLVSLTDQQQAEYGRASCITNPLIRHQKMSRAARRASDGSSSLLPTAAHFVVEQARAGNKVVLFTEELLDVDKLCDLLKEQEVGSVSLRGEDDLAAREDAVASFRDCPAVSVLVGTKVLEHGLNLQFANVLVSVCVSYNPGREAQREGRLRRIGSPNATFRHLAFLPDTQQVREQLSTLHRKSLDAAPIMGSYTPTNMHDGTTDASHADIRASQPIRTL